MYDIANLLAKERDLKNHFKNHFAEFFKQHDYKVPKPTIRYIPIEAHCDLSNVRYGAGLYFLLSDYRQKDNLCTLSVNNLKVVYRGHGVRIRKRVESHIFNSSYNHNPEGTTYRVCMKLDGNNGIDIDRAPYDDYKWAVLYHSMPKSTKIIREQAEQAFDKVYCRPIGSFV